MKKLFGTKQYSAGRAKKLVLQAAFGILTLTMAANAHALSFTVDAFANSKTGGTGLDTGIVLTAGQLFSVQVDPNDLWNAGALPRWSDANGLDGLLLATGTDESLQAAGTVIGTNFGTYGFASYGSLVGELSGSYFKLGTYFSGPAVKSGTLKLYYWDSNNYDNTGSISADIQVAVNAVPEPSTLLLLGCGLLGIAGLGRKRKNQA